MWPNANSIPVWFITISIGFSLSACAPIVLDSSTQAEDETQVAGYPGPETPQPTISAVREGNPTDVGGGPSRIGEAYPTLSPKDLAAMPSVELGLAPIGKKSDALITAESTVIDDLVSERFTVLVNGSEVVLGGEGGTAKWGALGARTFAWFFLCDNCKALDQGLYVLDLQTGKQRMVSPDALNLLGSVEIAEPWLVYYTPGEGGLATIHAYNTDTTKDTVLDTHVPYDLAGPQGKLAVNEGAAAWLATNPSGTGFALKWIDLDSYEAHIITGDSVARASGLAVSKSLVVWGDDYWKVYDIRAESTYTLPIIPESIDRSRIVGLSVSPPVIVGRTVYWSVTAADDRHDLSVQVGR